MRSTIGEDALEYQTLLDRILEDRRITSEEGAELEALARGSGLSREQARAANERYLLDLLRLALEDGVISAAEADDLGEVQRLLGVDDETYAHLEQRARKDPSRPARSRAQPALAGQSVCFTGTLNCRIHGQRATREMAHQYAENVGMVVRKNVSKRLGMLVLADPDSASGKARRAREVGVRLVAEPVFWRMVGASIE